MVTGTAIKCDKEAEKHSGTLRKDGDGHICQSCYDEEHGIERKESEGRQITCPNCGKILMTRYRGGKVSIGSMKMTGSKATLVCECGYKKIVDNPFGGRASGKDKALQLAKTAEKKRKGDGNAGREDRESSGDTDQN